PSTLTLPRMPGPGSEAGEDNIDIGDVGVVIGATGAGPESGTHWIGGRARDHKSVNRCERCAGRQSRSRLPRVAHLVRCNPNSNRCAAVLIDNQRQMEMIERGSGVVEVVLMQLIAEGREGSRINKDASGTHVANGNVIVVRVVRKAVIEGVQPDTERAV